VTSTALACSGLVKTYGQVRALDGVTVDLTAPATGLLGANGAGKSTLMKLALGLLQPDSGTVQVLGLDSDQGRAEIRSRVGYMPEHSCLPTDMSAQDLCIHLARLRGLPRRDALRRATRSATDGGGALTLALLDVDHFKTVNDRFGHAVGDEVLCALADRLRAATAGAGSLARVGGEEFALLMPGTDAASAHRLLASALAAVRSTPFPTAGTVTASAGVAQLLGDMDDDALYRLADTLLYEAKARGRDQVR